MKLSILLIIIPLLFISLPSVEEGKKVVKYYHPNGNYKIKKICIDAGHGGKDPGCKGNKLKTKEKNVVLPIALKLGNYINDNLPDIEVIYTRKTDDFVELHERANIANRNKVDLFISIHCNSSPAKNIAGAETYLMGLAKTADNLEVSRRENEVISMESNFEKNYDGYDPNSAESNIIFSLYQNAFIDQSIKFASLVQKQFRERAGRISRGVKQENFLVIYKTAMPSVLIETGFLSNAKEEQFLSTDDGQAYIASAIYRAFKEYKQSLEHTYIPIYSKDINWAWNKN